MNPAQANTTVSELLAEVERLRPHYQSGTATDAGRRQMLDHFATFADELSARRATADVTEANQASKCDGQLCYYHGCQHLPGCVQVAALNPPMGR